MIGVEVYIEIVYHRFISEPEVAVKPGPLFNLIYFAFLFYY